MVSCKSAISLEMKHKTVFIPINRAGLEPEYWAEIFLFVPELVGVTYVTYWSSC